MIGLIKKDLLMIKNNLKIVIIIFIIFGLSSFQNGSDMSFLPALISMMLFISTFSYDEYNKWDAYAITLPNGRNNIVISKYVASMILSIIAIILSYFLSLLIGYFNNDINFEKMSFVMFGTFTAITFIQCIMYPFIFKYGVEKGRISLFVIIFSLGFILSLFSKNINEFVTKEFLEFLYNYWYVLLPLFTTFITYISYTISKNIYLKKEF